MPRGFYERASPETRFWRKVAKTSTCWLWTGTTARFGYGSIRVNGRYRVAHRFSWELAHGSIPKGLFILHHCDVPGCVKPAHLFLGTQRDNSLDMHRKKRHPWSNGRPGNPMGIHTIVTRGEISGMAKLTDEKVREIRRLYIRGKTSQIRLARQFGVDQTTISRILLRQTWNHIN